MKNSQMFKNLKAVCQASVLAALAFALPNQAQAAGPYIINGNFADDSVNVDYNGGAVPAPTSVQMVGPAAIGSAGDLWNSLSGFAYNGYPNNASFTSGNLKYSAANELSTVKVSLFAPAGTYDNNSINWGNFSQFSWPNAGDEGTPGTGYPNTPYAVLMQALLDAGATTTGYVSFSGLAPNSVYNLYTYSAGDGGSQGRVTTLWVTQGTPTSIGAAQGPSQNCTNNTSDTNLVQNVNYAEFAGVQSDANGNLTLFFGNNGLGENDLDGFQLQWVSGTQPIVFGPAPVITETANLNGLTLCTNTSLSITNTSLFDTISSLKITNVTSTFGTSVSSTNVATITANGSYAGGPAGCTITVTGMGTATAVATMTLPQNLNYTVSEVATDSQPLTTAATISFDTIKPSLVIEGTDFNFNGGQYVDTPANGGIYAYTNDVGDQGVDENKNPNNASTSVPYRGGSEEATIQNSGSTTFIPQQFAVLNDKWLVVDYTSTADWFDYTRTYGSGGGASAPAGTYNFWFCMGTSGAGEQATLSLINGDPTSSSQTPTVLGQFGTSSFSENAWAGYEYVPLTDQYGNLVAATIPSGPQTLRLTQVGNPNVGFLMLTPAIANPAPGFKYFYPDAVHPFEATNHLTFTVSPNQGSAIAQSGIQVIVNGVDVTAQTTLSQSSGMWTGNYPLVSNAVYTATINVTNESNLGVSLPLSFDTFSINNYQWEAVDYDFSTNNGTAWISGLFIDNPVPTCDTTAPQTGEEAANSYFAFPTGFDPGVDPNGLGAIAQQGIDINFGNFGQTQANEYYRADGVGSQPASDYVRPKFVASRTFYGDPNIGPINIGYYGTGAWMNYSRHYPSGNWNIWGRLAGGNGPYSGTTISNVISGVGTTNQALSFVGSFADPNAAGWQTWHWIKLLDANNNPAVISFDGNVHTLRITSGNNINTEFFMLTQAPLVFSVTASVSGSQITLSVPSQSGHNYQLLFKSSLNAASWSPVGSAKAGTGGTLSWTESLSTQGYYEVEAQ